MLSKKGFKIETAKTEKDSTSIKKVKNRSDIYIEGSDNRNIDIKDIESSKIQIAK